MKTTEGQGRKTTEGQGMITTEGQGMNKLLRVKV